MLTSTVQGNRSGPAASWLAGVLGAVSASRSRLLFTILVTALVASVAGLGIYKRAEIADVLARGSKVLGESASAAGSSPLAKSMAALLGQRSPGERTKGELANDKRRYAERPTQRALGKIRPALPAPFVKALTNPIPDVVTEVAPLLAQNPLVPNIVPAAASSSPAVFVVAAAAAAAAVAVAGGGGGGGGGTPPPNIEVPPVVPPVPEPATWLTMLLGFAFVARALRKQRPASVRGAFQAA